MDTCRIESLFDDLGKQSALIATPSVLHLASDFPVRAYRDFDQLPDHLDRLIVIGGGSLIDRAKLWKFNASRDVELVAIPSIWGSGAEVSPVAVYFEGAHKKALVDPALVPDKACFWPELVDSIPEKLALFACGDAWSHAIEGFLSPLADDDLRSELAAVMRAMQELPLASDARWFEPSARASAGQARSSVGLVHGIAHTLELELQRKFPNEGWGHARLCSVFLLPVMEFNRLQSDKWKNLARDYELDSEAVFSVLEQLFDAAAYNQALPLLDRHWMEILRDPCSRTNSSLVRPAGKAFFMEQFKR